MKNIKTNNSPITSKEFEVMSMEVDSISDLDYGRNSVTGEYDVPAVEFDGIYGKHWVYYNSEEDRSEALKKHNKKCEDWLKDYRIRKVLADIYKGKVIGEKKRMMKEAKTLGGQFPVLKQLLEKTRLEYV